MEENRDKTTPSGAVNVPQKPEPNPAEPTSGAAPQAGLDMDQLAQTIAQIIEAHSVAGPDPVDKALARKERRARVHKRRMRDLRDLLIRTALLAVVVYVLFFHIVGLVIMPSEDMYPRIDAGDLVLYYRLDREVKAQDIVVYTKDVADVQVREPEPTPRAYHTPIPKATEAPADTAPAATAAQGATDDAEATRQPGTPRQDAVPADIVADSGIRGKFNRAVYNLQVSLGLKNRTGQQVFVGRVVAVGGDTVDITENGSLMVNGNHMIEPNIFYTTVAFDEFTEYPLTLKEDECFVLADRRDIGADSRFFGPVAREQIIGTAITVVRRNNL